MRQIFVIHIHLQRSFKNTLLISLKHFEDFVNKCCTQFLFVLKERYISVPQSELHSVG